MILENWTLKDNCDSVQFYFSLKENDNVIMEICVPDSVNNFRWLCRICVDNKNFDRWANSTDYEFMFDTYADMMQVVDDNYHIFIVNKKEVYD